MPSPTPYTPPQSCEPPLHPYPRIPREYQTSSCSPQPSTSKGVTHSHARTPRGSRKSSDSPQPSTSSGITHVPPRVGYNSQSSSDTEESHSSVPSSVVLEKLLSNPKVRRQLLQDTSGTPPRSPSPLVQSSDSSEEEFQPPSKGSSKRPVHKKGTQRKGVQVDEEVDDEALKDPDHFIKIFTAANGPVSKFTPKFVQSLLQTLEKYLDKVNRSPNDPKFMNTKSKYSGASAGNVDFVEAAFVVQGSSEIYGKKVDLLFNAAVNLVRLLSQPFDDVESDGEEEDAEPGATPKAKKGTKRPRLALENRDLAEEILEVDNFTEGKKIDQKRTVQGRFKDVIRDVIKRPIVNIQLLPPIIPRLVRKTKALSTNPEDAQKFNSKRVPQFGQGLESRGFVDEYRLNEDIRMVDSMLVDHIVPVGEDQQVPDEINLDVEEASENVAETAEETITASQELNAATEAPVTTSKSTTADETAATSDSQTLPSERTEPFSEDAVVSSESTEVHESTGSNEESSALVEDNTLNANKLSQTPVNTCDSGIDSCPSSVYNPVENSGVQDLSWEGNSSAVCVESDAISVLDDGCASADGGESEVEGEDGSRVASDDKNVADSVESGIEVSENERSGPESSGALRIDQESHSTDPDRDGAIMDVSDTTDVSSPCEKRTPQKNTGLQEMSFIPTPKRSKRKIKNFKLPCKLSLLLPDKKRKRGSRAAELWKPSQSPSSSSSSTYPQSPMSYSAPSPDHNSLHLIINDDESGCVPLEPLSESDNEGEFIDAGDQSQVNYWIRNHEKDLISAGQVCTLSDRVAQWQELIQPRLEANLTHGPYSHVKYAPILLELVSRKGWTCPKSSKAEEDTDKEARELESLEDEFIFPLDWKKELPVMRGKASIEESYISFRIPYDFDFVEPRECDGAWGGDSFPGFPSVKKIKRRGVILTLDSVESDSASGLFAAMCRIYDWGYSEEERALLRHEEEAENWRREKNSWLKSKVGKPLRRNWDEWTEENDNIEVNMDMDVSSMSVATIGHSEPVPFTNIISGLRKEEVSRLLFTALHLASQGHMNITSTTGEINSMELSLCSNTER